MKIGLISCTKLKNDYKCSAKELYDKSSLFKKAYNYCNLRYDDIYILSAKYKLVHQNEEIETYDLTLNNFKIDEKKDWAKEVYDQIKTIPDYKNNTYYLHAGNNYIEYLIEYFKEDNILYEITFEGSSIERLQFYNEVMQ